MQIYTKKYFVNFLSIILNVHNDPCFEDKSSSFTLKYRPVHFLYTFCTTVSFKKPNRNALVFGFMKWTLRSTFLPSDV